jgi:PhnB protein
MPQINPYIHFNGNTEEAFHFYRSVLGGDFSTIIRFKDVMSPEQLGESKEADKIMQIILSFGQGASLMGSDVPEFMGRVNENENRSKILLSADSKEQADQFFQGLSAGGEVEVPIAFSPWGPYFGMFRDRYGIEWMVEYRKGL